MKAASAGSAPDLLGGTWLQAPDLGNGAPPSSDSLGSVWAPPGPALPSFQAFPSSRLSREPSKRWATREGLGTTVGFLEIANNRQFPS